MAETSGEKLDENTQAFQSLLDSVEKKGAGPVHKFISDVYAFAPKVDEYLKSQPETKPAARDSPDFFSFKTLVRTVFTKAGGTAGTGLATVQQFIKSACALLFIAEESVDRIEEVKRQINVVIAGLEGAGKSSLLYDLVMGMRVKSPDEFVVEKFLFRGKEFIITNLGGEEHHRDMWPKYFEKAHLLLYVMDSSKPDKFKQAKEDLTHILAEKSLPASVPLIVCANKADLPTAQTPEQINQALELDKIKNRLAAVSSTAVINTHEISKNLLRMLSFGPGNETINHLICEYALPLTSLEEIFDWVIDDVLKSPSS